MIPLFQRLNPSLIMAFLQCLCLNSTDCMRVFCEELLNLHRGQGQDILWRDQVLCPSEDQYKQMVLDSKSRYFIINNYYYHTSSL